MYVLSLTHMELCTVQARSQQAEHAERNVDSITALIPTNQAKGIFHFNS